MHRALHRRRRPAGKDDGSCLSSRSVVDSQPIDAQFPTSPSSFFRGLIMLAKVLGWLRRRCVGRYVYMHHGNGCCPFSLKRDGLPDIAAVQRRRRAAWSSPVLPSTEPNCCSDVDAPTLEVLAIQPREVVSERPLFEPRKARFLHLWSFPCVSCVLPRFCSLPSSPPGRRRAEAAGRIHLTLQRHRLTGWKATAA